MNKFELDGLNFWYNDFWALKDVTMGIRANGVTAFIGPSGCGKSTLIKCLNRMNDLVEGGRAAGRVLLDGEDIYGNGVSGTGGADGGGGGIGGGGSIFRSGSGGSGSGSGGGSIFHIGGTGGSIFHSGGGIGGGGYSAAVDVNMLRKKVGMVFQKPNPFPMSVYDNIAYGPRAHGIKSKYLLDGIVEKSLSDAAIWGETKDRLKKSALSLSGGQQQRLCIARALSVSPEVLLMDEPTSALDPISTSKIEDLVAELKKRYTVVVVTHNMQQAARISDMTAFFLLGELIEYGATEQVFAAPRDRRCEGYITGRFG